MCMDVSCVCHLDMKQQRSCSCLFFVFFWIFWIIVWIVFECVCIISNSIVQINCFFFENPNFFVQFSSLRYICICVDNNKNCDQFSIHYLCIWVSFGFGNEMFFKMNPMNKHWQFKCIDVSFFFLRDNCILVLLFDHWFIELWLSCIYRLQNWCDVPCVVCVFMCLNVYNRKIITSHAYTTRTHRMLMTNFKCLY